MTRRVRFLLAGAALLALANTDAPGGVLVVEVSNVRVAKGQVRVDVCAQAQFLSERCPWHGASAARVGTTRVTVTGLPAGRYAVQAYLDENGNEKVDQALFGIPKEGIGFSNDAKIGFGPPKFHEAAFGFDGIERTIRLKLRYFLGSQGPEAQMRREN